MCVSKGTTMSPWIDGKVECLPMCNRYSVFHAGVPYGASDDGEGGAFSPVAGFAELSALRLRPIYLDV